MLDTIRDLLKSKEWEFEGLENQISTSFRTELDDNHEHTFPLYFTVLDGISGRKCVRMTVTPFVEKPESGYPFVLYENIALVNHDLAQAKFAIDDDEDLELIIDLPVPIVNDDLDNAISLLAEISGAYFIGISDLLQEE